MDGWSREARLTVITGPVFEDENGEVSYRVIGTNRVAVPTAFFKIVVDDNVDPPQALAFLLPNESLSGQSFHDRLESIDEIERLTGIDFLTELAEDVETTLEQDAAPNVW